MSIYDQLGVRPVINAAATFTAVGGSLMPDPVLAAMRAAAGSYVDMHELQEAAGAHLAALTHNEAAMVTSGCAAALVLGTLGAITGGRPQATLEFAQTGLAKNVVMHSAHRIPYDPAIRLAGGNIVQIGNVLQTFDWELEAALTDRTALVMWVAGSHLARGALDLQTTVRIAHSHGIPVLVDAAAQLPPHTNLWHFTRDLGADAAVFSGGKSLRGPQASGLMVGTASFVAAARSNASPHQRLARALKVGKEEIAGLVRAVELFISRDHAAIAAQWEETVLDWIDRLNGVPGLAAARDFPNEAGQPVPRVKVQLDPTQLDLTADELRQRLWDGEPRLLVLQGEADSFFITPDTLAVDEAARLPDLIIGALGASSER